MTLHYNTPWIPPSPLKGWLCPVLVSMRPLGPPQRIQCCWLEEAKKSDPKHWRRTGSLRTGPLWSNKTPESQTHTLIHRENRCCVAALFGSLRDRKPPLGGDLCTHNRGHGDGWIRPTAPLSVCVEYKWPRGVTADTTIQSTIHGTGSCETPRRVLPLR